MQIRFDRVTVVFTVADIDRTEKFYRNHFGFEFDRIENAEEGTFEEGGNFYLQTGTALFQTLDAITSDVASRAPLPAAPSIAAHCAHLAYYIHVNHAAIVGREQHVDWPSSWRVQSIGLGEWDVLKKRLRSEYGELMTTLNSQPWEEDSVCDSIAIVAHTAYHLGAIRQIQRLLGAASGCDA